MKKKSLYLYISCAIFVTHCSNNTQSLRLPDSIRQALLIGDIKTVTNYFETNATYVNAVDSTGNTPLLIIIKPKMLRAMKQETLDAHHVILATLIDHKADIEKRDKQKRTPLMAAITTKRRAMIKPLVDAGASLDCVDINSRTPLMLAILSEDIEIVKELVQCAKERISGNELFDAYLQALYLRDSKNASFEAIANYLYTAYRNSFAPKAPTIIKSGRDYIINNGRSSTTKKAKSVSFSKNKSTSSSKKYLYVDDEDIDDEIDE